MATHAYWRTFNTLREHVLSGHYASGQRIPAERQLSEQYGVSRITIRHAMRLLREQGLVESFPGRGTFVRAARPKKLPIFSNDFAASIRSEAPDLERRLISYGTIKAPSRIVETLGLMKSGECFLAERLDLLNDEPLAFDRAFIPLCHAGGLDEKMLVRVDFLNAWLSQNGLVMSHGVESIEAVEADLESVRRLRVEARRPMLLATDVIYGAEGRAFAVFETIYRADRYKLVSTNPGGV